MSDEDNALLLFLDELWGNSDFSSKAHELGFSRPHPSTHNLALELGLFVPNSSNASELHSVLLNQLKDELTHKTLNTLGEADFLSNLRLRLHVLQKIQAAITRRIQHDKEAAAQRANELDSVLKAAEPPLALLTRLALKAASSTGLMLVENAAQQNPEVIQRVLSICSELMAELKPLSLTAAVSGYTAEINACIQPIFRFIKSLLHSNSAVVTPEVRREVFALVLSLGVARGSVEELLDCVNWLVKSADVGPFVVKPLLASLLAHAPEAGSSFSSLSPFPNSPPHVLCVDTTA
eukprot:TRINITY_DN6666_c0_g3_i2.p1 TRINITY_DN6666_c0_g3~~TRINITY_DN6666_c0_g3_i2.p1  ORF type:complete len:307 (+),score=127.34 TRINITY_DN6666_c0_g3_i2:44-922(+)